MAADKSQPRRPASKKALSAPLPSKSRKPPMSASEPSQPTVFEIERIRRLVELMKEHDLSEIDLRESRQHIRICRGPKELPRPASASSSPAAHAPAAAPPLAATSAAATADGPNIAVIKSPMIGTFYSRPNPKAEAYVKVGDRVDTTTVVCIIEAMKVMNEIKAEVKGIITQILVENAKPVEFGQPLFKIRPT
jgi:acetyl-CoA carboxylase biotin carboxyl carrier protein